MRLHAPKRRPKQLSHELASLPHAITYRHTDSPSHSQISDWRVGCGCDSLTSCSAEIGRRNSVLPRLAGPLRASP